MQTSHGERFLRAYAEFERWLRSYLRKDQGFPYKKMIDQLRERSKITEAQYLQLQTIGYLRNALAHWDRTAEGVAIAEPRPDVVDQFCELFRVVMQPARVVDVLNADVMCLRLDSTVDDFLSLVRD